jgi:hypothetical protein
MVRAPDFDRKMLLLATQMAQKSNMKGLLLSVLDALLQTLNNPERDMITEAMTLIRCAIRLITSLMTEPGANQYVPITSRMSSVPQFFFLQADPYWIPG